MIDETSIGIAVAVAVLLSPLPFLLAIGAAIFVRTRTSRVPPILRSIVTFTAGLALGTMTLAASEPWLLVPILGFPLMLLVSLWRSRRRVEAGWLLAGASLPPPIDDAPVHVSQRAPFEILGAVLLGLFLSALDQTIVGPSCPGSSPS